MTQDCMLSPFLFNLNGKGIMEKVLENFDSSLKNRGNLQTTFVTIKISVCWPAL